MKTLFSLKEVGPTVQQTGEDDRYRVFGTEFFIGPRVDGCRSVGAAWRHGRRGQRDANQMLIGGVG